MAFKNNESVQRCVRVKHAKDTWFQKRANLNPDNKYNQVAVEINAITDQAFQADPKLANFKAELKRG